MKIIKNNKDLESLKSEKYSGLVKTTDHFVITIDQDDLCLLDEGTMIYLENGIIHRSDGPAIIQSVGFGISEIYVENGKYVNKPDSPSVIMKFVNSEEHLTWLNQKGKRHNEFGPARITPKTQEYYLNGKNMDKELYEKTIAKKNLKNKIKDL